jgi:hypothetical protein
MYLSGILSLGIVLLSLGIGIYLLVRLSIRVVFQPDGSILFPQLTETNLAASKYRAILIVQSGGRLIYADPTAREWFGIPNQASDLESLVSQTSPEDAFLNLCALGNGSTFQVRTRQVEGNSYPFPIGTLSANLIALNEINFKDPNLDKGKLTGSSVQPDFNALSQLSESILWFNQATATNADIQWVVQTLIECVRTLVVCDLVEVNLLDPSSQQITRFTSRRDQGGQDVSEVLEHSFENSTGFTRHLIKERTNSFISDTASEHWTIPTTQGNHYRSYLGIPLLYADEPIGTMELASFQEHKFREQEIEFLNLLSNQATLALRIAQLNNNQDGNAETIETRTSSIKSSGEFSNENTYISS